MTMDKGSYEAGIYRMGDVRIMDRSAEKRLPIGYDGFETVADRSLFVDKSLLVADILGGNYPITLFCRPRRFGKTLAMTMLKAFFEIPVDGIDKAPLFEGLAIWDACDGRYRAEQGVRPTIFFTLNDVKKATWEGCYEALEGKAAAEYQRHGYLAQSDALTEQERAQFLRVSGMSGTRNDVESSLRQLALYLRKHYNRRVVVLIDEYDAPVMAGHEKGYYRQVVDFMKGWLTGALKDGGAALDLACLTGVQRIAKESIFSDLNNLTVDTALDTESEERFGFTEKEVAALASYLGYPHKRDEVKYWYDGYRFGDADIYNPWSVLNYFSRGCRPGVYWANTASNLAVGDAVRSSSESLRDVFALMEPCGFVERPLDMGVVFSETGERGKALWSLLYLAGYLTTNDTYDPGNRRIPRRLRLPNREVAEVFRTEIVERFEDECGGYERLRDLHGALASGDAAALEAELAHILATSPSFRDLTSENSYHMLMTGLLFGVPGYADPQSNREGGNGLFDLRLSPEVRPDRPPRPDLPVITVELKVLDKAHAPVDSPQALAEKLAELAQTALGQIDRRSYDRDVPNPRLRYGVAFAGKAVSVVCERA